MTIIPFQPMADPVFFPSRLQAMDTAVEETIEQGKVPGGVLWLERTGTPYSKAYGHRALQPEKEPMTPDTVFDLASLTKVIATTPAMLLLVERDQVRVKEPVQHYIPEFRGHGKESITVEQLMTHTSGLRPGLSPRPAWSGYPKAIELACAEKPLAAPGAVFRYSDINFILLGEIVERVTQMPLEQFVAREIYEPLGMSDTGFRPSDSMRDRIAPTQKVEGEILRGTVHDPTSRRMGGVAGHAGLFSTAADLARFARMLLNQGSLEGTRVFQPETVQFMTRVHTPEMVPARRGLGWDIDSPYSRPRGKHFPLGSYGHTGFTGTSIWIDPFSKSFWIFLSNRVHPDGRGNVLALQQRLGSLAAEAVSEFNFAFVPGALPPRTQSKPRASRKTGSPETESGGNVQNGIDVLAEEDFQPLRNLRVGLITNHTGQDRQRRATIDLLHQASQVNLKALFTPEHGLRGIREEPIDDTVDDKTGLPVYSLYGERRAPTAQQLNQLDALIFDIQDIGCRYYTYISTMGLCLEAAADAGLKFFVLDRVNPINGTDLDGPVLNGETGFTGFHPIPVRHGMTVGELARMFNAERDYQADLTVIRVQGWQRGFWFDQTGLPWTNPSPNIRDLTAAMLYPGIGLLETTPLSVGRGTDTPFHHIGAPYIDDVELAAELNQAALPGIRFLPTRFTPQASVYKEERCRGVQILLTDRTQCRVVDVGITIARTLHRLYPDAYDLDAFNRLLVHRATLDAIKAGKSLSEIRQTWEMDMDEFKKRRRQYLLY